MATIFKLIIEDDEGKTTVYPLADGEISIGRREGNTIRLMERNVSRRHAKLLRNNGAVFVEDLDSYNGIRINGERISGRYEVKEGDLVEIGDYHLALQRSEVKEEVPATEVEVPTRADGWPQAGTVPDFRLPEELLAEARRELKTGRDTLVDHAAPQQAPAPVTNTLNERGGFSTTIPGTNGPLVKPPPRGQDSAASLRDLPPFPTPGGLPAPKSPLFPASTSAPEARERADTEILPKPTTQGPALVAPVPRLICVSTSYAGREFALTRPELIIGRVEDNDIVIEHRSVSRNHAKILFDGRTHKIIDLQSANGILVNGEEYAMTDLRKGDLVELGHVRFRFIPANEPFSATEEEIREMREAGVEPPAPPPPAAPGPLLSAPPIERDVGDVGTYDPSTAQTVTDAPLSALSMSESFSPRVESRTVPAGSPRGAAPSPAAAAREAPVKRATEDERPTEINRYPARAPAGGEPSAVEALARSETRTDDVLEKPRSTRSRTPLLVGVVIGLLSLVVLTVVLLTSKRPDGTHDVQLQELFARQSWGEVVGYYESNEGGFKDERRAVEMYGGAKLMLKGVDAARPAPPPEPPPGIPDAPEPEPELELRAPGGSAQAAGVATPGLRKPEALEPEAPEAEEDEPRQRPGAASESRAAAARRAKKLEEAKRLSAEGKRALMQGELSKAEELLTRCIAADPNHADCHRSLGVYYAQRDDTKQSIKHYRRYIQLRPNAPDAVRVKEMIDTAQASSAGSR